MALTMPDIDQTITIEENNFKLEAFISHHNKRIRIIDYKGPEIDKALDRLNGIASKHNFATKIFAKVRPSDTEAFLKKGFEQEAVIKGYFNGRNAHIMSKFCTDKRRTIEPVVMEKEKQVKSILEETVPVLNPSPELPKGYTFKIAQHDEDFAQLAQLYKKVFESYPFAIYDPDYLKETAETHIIYGLIFNNKGKLTAAASAETTPDYKNAEMTDFATLPQERGKGLAFYLLYHLEEEAKNRGIKYFYTIARSRSIGMNRVFKKAGYKQTGKLKKNCNICGSLENMTVWCKPLETAE